MQKFNLVFYWLGMEKTFVVGFFFFCKAEENIHAMVYKREALHPKSPYPPPASSSIF